MNSDHIGSGLFSFQFFSRTVSRKHLINIQDILNAEPGQWQESKISWSELLFYLH